MSIENATAMGRGRLTFVAALFAITLSLGACGGGGGGGSSSDGGSSGGGGTEVPTGDTDLSAGSLQGQWVGTVEPYQSGGGKFRQLLIQFDSAGDITRVDLDGSTLTGVTGTYEGKPTASGQILEYTLDGDTMYLYADPSAAHAGIAFADGTVGVIEKGASTSPSYAAADATGSWSGTSVYLVVNPELAEDGFDNASGSYATSGSDVISNDLSFVATGDAQDCLNLDHTLSGFNASYGVYDDSTATGGDGECPGSETVPADAYMSPDATFMVIVGGCEAADDASGTVDECSFVVMSKQ